MGIAKSVSTRATCSKIKVGAVLVKDKQIVGTGYNGAPKGQEHCVDDKSCCILFHGHCLRVVHAEVNAILQAQEKTEAADLYVTHLPCVECCKIIINAKIKNVFYEKNYIDDRAACLGLTQVEYLQAASISVHQIMSGDISE